MKYGYQCFHFAKEATVPAAQTCYIVAYICIASLDIVGIAFVMNVAFMPADKIYPKIALPPSVWYFSACTVSSTISCIRAAFTELSTAKATILNAVLSASTPLEFLPRAVWALIRYV